jgi:hypothetical protein
MWSAKRGSHKMKLKDIFFLSVIVSLAACSAPTFGLKPIYPKNLCSRPQSDCSILFREVDSLQPVLRWEVFPSEDVRRSSEAEVINRIRNVTYDLNVWISENDYPSSLIYSRRGLPEPRHKIEEPLLPCAEYFWTVRARFLIDGKERVSEWGISAWPEPIEVASAAEVVRRLPVVPHPNLYRFMAPCPEKAEGRPGHHEYIRWK